ncbi:hypothetical protein DFH11DRAFT_1546658 [Phellopilus nigrolimitatus]|nr:hypothetical protein DFH11DRAFT_1546658 [Phellopilus nigrolimitatus]
MLETERRFFSLEERLEKPGCCARHAHPADDVNGPTLLPCGAVPASDYNPTTSLRATPPAPLDEQHLLGVPDHTSTRRSSIYRATTAAHGLALKDLQGIVIPRYHGLYFGGGDESQTEFACIVLEVCVDPLPDEFAEHRSQDEKIEILQQLLEVHSKGEFVPTAFEAENVRRRGSAAAPVSSSAPAQRHRKTDAQNAGDSTASVWNLAMRVREQRCASELERSRLTLPFFPLRFFFFRLVRGQHHILREDLRGHTPTPRSKSKNVPALQRDIDIDALSSFRGQSSFDEQVLR